jgi:hypothetical protein
MAVGFIRIRFMLRVEFFEFHRRGDTIHWHYITHSRFILLLLWQLKTDLLVCTRNVREFF